MLRKGFEWVGVNCQHLWDNAVLRYDGYIQAIVEVGGLKTKVNAKNDVDFSTRLIEKTKAVTVPGSSLYLDMDKIKPVFVSAKNGRHFTL